MLRPLACAIIIPKGDGVGKKWPNKAMQIDNLRGVVYVHARSAPIVAHKPPPHTPRLNLAVCEIKKNDMKYQSINLNEKLGKFQEQWAPKVIAEMNDYQFKIVKLEGEFVWHSHAETDEAFLVIDGELRIDFRDGAVNLSKGEMYVVPRGIEHKPFAEKEVKLMLIEPRGVLNTGDAEQSEITAVNDVWV